MWIASAYTISYAVASVLYGSLADLFGRRWFAISAGGFVALGSLIAALGKNVNTGMKFCLVVLNLCAT
jgi:MFS family permease